MPMPVDARSRRIAVVCHCLLNANAKVEGLAEYGAVHPVVLELANRGYGVIQMPCAEMAVAGMCRWGQTLEQYDTPHMNRLCDSLSAETADQVAEFLRCGYEVAGVIGVDGSPTCGVHVAASGDWGGEPSPEEWAETVAESTRSQQPGVHIRALMRRLEPYGVRFAAIDESVEGHNVEAVLAELGVA